MIQSKHVYPGEDTAGKKAPLMFSFFTQRGYCHLFVAMAIGIALGRKWPMPFGLFLSDWALVALVLAGTCFIWWLWRDLSDWRIICLGLGITLAIGFLSSSLAVGQALSAPLRDFTSYDPVSIVGRVSNMPKYQRGHLRFILDVETVNGVDAPGSCFVYLKCEEPPKLYMTDQIELFASLSEVDPPLNRGEFDFRGYLIQKGTVLTAYAISPNTLTRLTSFIPQPWATSAKLRQTLISNLESQVPGELGLLSVSVVFGDKITELPEELESRFRRAGLTHILVASGTQISLLIALVSLLFWRFTDDFSWVGLLKTLLQFCATMAIVLVYASITGFDTSIVRALLMGALIMLGRYFRREADGLSILAQSGLILLIANPLALFSAGFQLSFGATFGLIYILGATYQYVFSLSGVKSWVVGILVSTGGAQLFVAPLVASSFHQLSLWGMASNLVAIPLSFFLLIVGTLLSVGAGSIPLLGQLLAWFCHGASWFLNWWAGLFSALPGASINVPHQPLWWTVAFYTLVILVVEQAKHGSESGRFARQAYFYGSLLIALLITATFQSWLLVPKPGLVALSLNKGEAYIWRPHTGRTIVFAKSANLAKSHNADKLNDALVNLGINKIHAWQWIDGDSSAHELFEPWMLVEGATPAEFQGHDMVSIVVEGKTIGAVFALGHEHVFLYWDWQPGSLDTHNSLVASHGPPELLLLSKAAFDKTNRLEIDSMQSTAQIQIVHRPVSAYTKRTAGVTSHWGELNVLPGKVFLFSEQGLTKLRFE